MEYQHIRVEVSEGIASLTLNRPRYRNAQSRRMIEELDAAFTAVGDDDEVRAVILQGEGASFCSGHDLGTPDEKQDREGRPLPTGIGPVAVRSRAVFSEPVLRWRDVPKPTIAKVHGHCIYAGWTIASAMDVIVVSSDVSIVPHLSEYFSLPWIVGTRRAKQILFANQPVTAAQALEWGMVNEVVEPDELDARVRELAERFASADPYMQRMIKAAANDLEDQLGFRGSIRASHAYHMLTYFDGAARAEEDADGGRAKLAAVESALKSETKE